MARIDIKDIEPELIEELDRQMKIYGIKTRTEFFRLIIRLDVLTGIVGILKEKSEKDFKK